LSTARPSASKKFRQDKEEIVSTDVIQAVMAETQAGKLVFSEVVRRLLEIGVESYFCDLAAGTETFYMRDGQTHAEKMTLPMAPIAEEFSQSGLLTAIRGAQADAIRYPEFAKRSAAAGVIAYWAFLTGRKVIYFGRKGESHTEDFPDAKK
jgi:uncharacterized protein YbcV (DUF1398 family)